MNDKDPIETPNADAVAMAPYFERVETLSDGLDKLREGGTKYLPQMPAEPDKVYKVRNDMSVLTDIYSDVVEGIASKPFTKMVTADNVPDDIQDLLKNIDGRGQNLHDFASLTFFNGVNVGIDWILVENTRVKPLPGGRVRSQAEEKALGVRPYTVRIAASSILEIKSKMIGGSDQIVKFRYKETVTKQGDDGHETKVTRIRVLEREGDTVTYTVYEKRQKENMRQMEWVEVPEDGGTYSIGVIPVVPFITGRRKGASWQFNAPMRKALDLQFELYQQENNLKWTDTCAAIPMLAGNGVTPVKDENGVIQELIVGPGTQLYAPPVNGEGAGGRWEILSPQPGIFQYLQSRVKDTKEDIRELGRAPLTAQSGNLTVISSAAASEKSNSAAQAWANTLKRTIENVIKLMGLWRNITDLEPVVFVDTDFDIMFDQSVGIDALNVMRENSDISHKTYMLEMKRRGVLNPDFEFDDEVELLTSEIPGDDKLDDLDAMV